MKKNVMISSKFTVNAISFVLCNYPLLLMTPAWHIWPSTICFDYDMYICVIVCHYSSNAEG